MHYLPPQLVTQKRIHHATGTCRAYFMPDGHMNIPCSSAGNRDDPQACSVSKDNVTLLMISPQLKFKSLQYMLLVCWWRSNGKLASKHGRTSHWEWSWLIKTFGIPLNGHTLYCGCLVHAPQASHADLLIQRWWYVLWIYGILEGRITLASSPTTLYLLRYLMSSSKTLQIFCHL